MSDLSSLQDTVLKDSASVFAKIGKLFILSDKSKENLEKFIQYISKGYWPIIYSNHQSHADGVMIATLVGKIRSNVSEGVLKGFFCPIAASMLTGDQNENVQGGLSIFDPVLKKVGFSMVPIVRGDDRKKYGMSGSNIKSLEMLFNAPKMKYGLVVFPEGSVRGGRLNEKGEIYGMKEVDEGGLLFACIKLWKREGSKPVLLPIGITNRKDTCQFS